MMRRWLIGMMGILSIWGFTAGAKAEVRVVFERSEKGAGFKFKSIPSPYRDDAAEKAIFTVVDGVVDPNSAGLEKLHDGRVPGDADQPDENFFFRNNTVGGRLVVDVGEEMVIRQVNTFSWHPTTRGPQVYTLYAADGKSAEFNLKPRQGTDPQSCGWKRVAAVDTRGEKSVGGGQYGVSVADPEGDLGRYRYLLLDVGRTESNDPFGNTFYSEIDVIGSRPAEVVATPVLPATSVPASLEPFQIAIDYSEMPELKEWIEGKLRPSVEKWYPLIVTMLASDGYTAPRRLTITFRKDMDGVAATNGTRIFCAGKWFTQNLQGEAVGAVIHELVHVVQAYRRVPANLVWLMEGIADYIRWFKYEPVASRPRPNPVRAKYTDSYRVSAAFLEYLASRHDHEIVVKFNAALRSGSYRPDLWKDFTGQTVDELWEEYMAALR